MAEPQQATPQNKKAHKETLFHLVPDDDSKDVLLHPDNARFVSPSANGNTGLEVGFHVPSQAQGYVITRLGRNADLILAKSLPNNPMSGVHVSFEINPQNYRILVSVRSKRLTSVTFWAEMDDETVNLVTGDGVIFYGQTYNISIASYTFKLIWHVIPGISTIEDIRNIAIEGYGVSEQRRRLLRTRDWATEFAVSEAQSWHITRLSATKRHPFQDLESRRVSIGSGAFGKVFHAIDQLQGYAFALKTVDLGRREDIELSRTLVNREVKLMEKLDHIHIIKLFGCQRFDTLQPEIAMELCDGSLAKLAGPTSKQSSAEIANICTVVLKQMLSALDYLASKIIVHRDMKPENVLYRKTESGYHFKLADFGLANFYHFAVSRCGTICYEAPELWPTVTNVHARQSPKMDVWSLMASCFAVLSRFAEFPPDSLQYTDSVDVLLAKAKLTPIAPMAALHPDQRASAAQMLVVLFNGEGLTTPRRNVPPLSTAGSETQPVDYTMPPTPMKVAAPAAARINKPGDLPLIAHKQGRNKPLDRKGQRVGVAKRKMKPRFANGNSPREKAVPHIRKENPKLAKAATQTAKLSSGPRKGTNKLTPRDVPEKKGCLQPQDQQDSESFWNVLPMPGAFMESN